MDGARASGLYPTAGALCAIDRAVQPAVSRRVAVVSIEAFGRGPGVEPPRVQILVVVANIQTRALKTEVEKGSM